MSHAPRKRFGQNFLRDEGIIEAIARAIAPDQAQHLVEIGPGEGAITQSLIASGCRFDAIELDRDLRTRLLASFSTYDNFTLHSADALKFDFASLQQGEQALRVIGNLPYNISTPLLFKLLDYGALIADMHFMLQLEVVERLAAEPGNKNWGRLGVMAQFQCEVEQLFEVPPESFFPPPKVQSAVIRLTPRQTPRWAQVDRESLAKVVSQAFSQRRKTLRNNFKNSLTDAQFETAGVDPQARAETLTIDQFTALAGISRS